MRILYFSTVIIFLLTFSSCKRDQSENDKEDQKKEASGQAEKEIKPIETDEGGRPKNPNYHPVNATIIGFVKGGANVNVILDELDIGNIYPIYSAVVDENNTFRFDFQVNEPSIYQLRFPNGNIHLFLRGGTVKVNTNLSDLGSYQVIGSPESMQLKEMYYLLNDLNSKTVELQDRVETLKKDKSKVKELLRLVDSLPIYYSAISKEKSKKLRNFVERLDTSMIALLAAFYLDADENYDFLIKTRNKFSKICPGSRFYKQLDDKLANIVPVGPGKDAPNTVASDPNGKEVQLASLKGNVVLLYFWASFSQPCRQENKKILDIYNRYRNKGFSVYAVSIDSEKKYWTDAIKEDKLNWVNVSNLLGWNDELTYIWKIDDIPYLVLIDRQGKITERGFRAFELEAKLKNVLFK